MAKAKKVKAGKDYPQFGIKKGDEHYVWAMKTQRGGVVRRSLNKPRQSQLTLSEYKVAAHQLNERIEDLQADNISDIEDAVQEIISEAGDLRDEQQDKLDNMPEGLQQGDTGQLIQERIDALESFIGELENIDFDEFEPDEEHEDYTEEEPVNGDGETEEQWASSKLDDVKAISLDVN